MYLTLFSKPCLCSHKPSVRGYKDNGEIDASYFPLSCWGAPQTPLSMEQQDSQPQAPKENKEFVKRFRATGDEVKKIEAKAAKAGLSFSEYCRRATLNKPVVERVPPDLRRQLGAAGNNLNQLARLANSGKLPGASIEALNELVNRLLETLR